MARAHPIVAAFNGGELTPLMGGRVDHEKQKNGCLMARNVILDVRGGSKSRPGFRMVAAAKYDDREVRLERFVFSNVQAYILEIGHLYIRFYKDQGQIQTDSTSYEEASPWTTEDVWNLDYDIWGNQTLLGTPYEIATPYTEDEIWTLQFAQSADVLYITNPIRNVRKLTRFAHDNWTITLADWKDGPYLEENIDGVTHLSVSATEGSNVTLLAEYLYRDTDMGLYDEDLGTPEDFCTVARPFCVFIFTAKAGRINTVKINITTQATAPDLATCYLYASDGAKATGAALATSDTQDFSTIGAKTFTFLSSAPSLVDSDQYAIVIGIATPDAAIQGDVTDVASADYLSGFAATATGAVTPLTTDWRLNINYYPTGVPEVFESTHVGSLWRIRHSGSSATTSFSAADQVTDPVQIKGKFYVDMSPDGSWIGRVVLQKTFNRHTWFDVASFHYSTKQEFEETTENVWYRLKCAVRDAGHCKGTLAQEERWGVLKITSVTNHRTAIADVITPFGSTDPSPFWREGAWSTKRGFPKTVCFHDQRLCFASTSHQPYTVWLGWTADHENFTPGDKDNSAFELTLDVLSDRVQWIISKDGLLIGSLGQIAQILPSKQGLLSQNNYDIRVKLESGTAENILPIKINTAALAVDRDRRKLNEIGYSIESDSLASLDLTRFAEHITKGGINQYCYQQNPDQTVWAVRDDGKLAALTYYRAENVLGWALHDTQGCFKSVACIPSSLGMSEGRDELWAVVRRTIAGQTKRFIEIQTDQSIAATSPDYVCLDCSLSYSGVAKTAFTGADHFEGETIPVVADGWYVGDFLISGGGFTLETAASIVHAGLGYTCITQPVNLEAGAVDGTAQGRAKRISKVYARFLNTVGGSYGASLAKLWPIKTFTPNVTLLDSPPTLFSGDVELSWPGDWSSDVAPIFVQDKPYPMTLLALIIEVTTND